MLGIQPKFQTCEKQKNREKKTPKEKQSHTHKIVFTWFGNLPTSTELQKFHYYKRKLQCAVTVFFFSKTTKRQNPNHKKKKKTAFISCAQDSQWATKTGQKFFVGPSLRSMD